MREVTIQLDADDPSMAFYVRVTLINDVYCKPAGSVTENQDGIYSIVPRDSYEHVFVCPGEEDIGKRNFYNLEISVVQNPYPSGAMAAGVLKVAEVAVKVEECESKI